MVISLWVVHFAKGKSLLSESTLTKLWTPAFSDRNEHSYCVSWEYKHLLFIFIFLMNGEE